MENKEEEKKKSKKGFRLRSRPGTSQSGKRGSIKLKRPIGSSQGSRGLIKPKTSMMKKRKPNVIKMNSHRAGLKLSTSKLKAVKLKDKLTKNNPTNVLKTSVDVGQKGMRKTVSEVFSNATADTMAPPSKLKKFGKVKIVKHADSKTTFNSSLNTLELVEGYQFDEELEAFSVRFNPSDSKLAIGLSDGHVHIKCIKGINAPRVFFTKEDMPVTHVRWSNDHQVYAGNAEGWLIQYDANKDKEIYAIQEKDNQILAMDYSQENKVLCTGGKDCGIRIYDNKTKEIVRHYTKGDWYSPGHSNRIFSTKFKHDDQNVILSGGWDSAIFIWDIRQSKYVDAFCGPNISGDTIDVKGDTILLGSHRSKDSLELWDFGKRKKICTVDWVPNSRVDNAYVYACQFSKVGENQILAGAAVRNEVQLFGRTITYVPAWTIKGFDRAIYSIDWGNTGTVLALAGGDGKCYMLKNKQF